MGNGITGQIMGHCKRHGYSPDYTAYWLRNTHCVVCGKLSAAPHHLVTRGAGGLDNTENLLSLCTTHHTEIGQIGIQTFANKYPVAKNRIAAAIDKEKVGLSGRDLPLDD